MCVLLFLILFFLSLSMVEEFIIVVFFYIESELIVLINKNIYLVCVKVDDC